MRCVWHRAWRYLIIVVVLAVVTLASFGVSAWRRGDDGLSALRLGDGPIAVLSPPQAPRETEVERILRELRTGRLVPTGEDAPAAGAPASLRSVLESVSTTSAPVGHLRIPRIEVDVDWFSGVHAGVLERGPGHWPGTPLPGGAGNAVLSGHRTTFTKPFGDLDLLEPGDLIEADVPGAGVVTYTVQSVSVVPEATYTDVVLRQPDDSPSAG